MKKPISAVLPLVLSVLALAGCWKAPKCMPGLPAVLTERGFGDPNEPVTIVWTSVEIEGMEGAVTLAGTGEIPPNNTRWVFVDPTPVWNCFTGVETRTFEQGVYAAAKASLWLQVGEGKRAGKLLFHFEPGWASISPPKSAPEGGDWQFDRVAMERLAKLLSSTPPSDLGTPVRK